MSTSYQPKYFETLDGVRYAKSGLPFTEASVLGAVGQILYERAESRGRAAVEWEFRIGDGDGTDTVLQPNLCFVSRERLESLGGDQRESPPFSPDIAVDIRSADTDNELRVRRTARFLDTGAVLVLDVDPAMRVIAAHSSDGVRAYASGERFEHPAAPWLVFDVSEAFAELDD